MVNSQITQLQSTKAPKMPLVPQLGKFMIFVRLFINCKWLLKLLIFAPFMPMFGISAIDILDVSFRNFHFQQLKTQGVQLVMPLRMDLMISWIIYHSMGLKVRATFYTVVTIRYQALYF